MYVCMSQNLSEVETTSVHMVLSGVCHKIGNNVCFDVIIPFVFYLLE